MKTRLFRASVRLCATMAFLLSPWAAIASAPSQPPGTVNASSRSPAAPDRARVETAPRSRTLLFASNTGQFDPRVRFQLRGGGGVWWFTDDALWLTVLERPAREGGVWAPARRGPEAGDEVQLRRGVHLRFTFPGMSPTAHLVATDPQPSKINYFLGNDAAKWRANVPTYSTLRWEGVYPGVNLVLGQIGAGLGLIVEANTDATLAPLQVRVEGVNTVRMDADGRLIANTAIGPVPLPTLLTADGTPLEPSTDGEVFTFHVVSRPFMPFAIQAPADDPSDLLYSTFLGGSDGDTGVSLALGPDGSVYTTGGTASTDFPITPGAFQTSYHIGFVTRLNADGSGLVYSTYLGGSGVDSPFAVAVGGNGSAYITGWTTSTDFPTTPGAFDTTFNGPSYYGDGFVTKLSADGSALIYSTYLGGSGWDIGYAITLGTDGSAYISGDVTSTDFPTTPGAFQTTQNGDDDAFVTRLNASGSGLVYSTFLGSTGSEYSVSIALGADGSAYLTGIAGTNFPTTPGAYDTSYNGNDDAFVTKLNATGSALVYSTYLGGSGDESGYGIAVGADGTAYITGYTYSVDFPTTPGAYDRTCGTDGLCNPTGQYGLEHSDGFVTALNVDGSGLIYSTYLGGSDNDGGLAIALGADSAAYVAGHVQSSDFPTTPGAFDTSYSGGICYGDEPCDDIILAKLDGSGSTLLYSTYLGGVNDDYILWNTLALGGDGTAYLQVNTESSDFPTTPGAFDRTCGCNPSEFDGDLAISRISPDLVRMHVASIDPFYRPIGGHYRVGARVTIQDASGMGVAGASVSVAVSLPDGSRRRYTRATNSRGTSTVSFLSSLSGTYTFTVTQVMKYGYLYDPAQNVETSDSITLP